MGAPKSAPPCARTHGLERGRGRAVGGPGTAAEVGAAREDARGRQGSEDCPGMGEGAGTGTKRPLAGPASSG